MIEGFKLRITAAELRDHCRERAEHHRRRAAEKAGQLPKLREAMECIKATPAARNVSGKSPASNYSLDPDDAVESLEKDIRAHDNKALVFDFFAAHLFDEDYTLVEADLIRLEILKH